MPREAFSIPQVGITLIASQGILHTPSGYNSHCLTRHPTYHNYVDHYLPRKAYSVPQVGSLLTASQGIPHTRVSTQILPHKAPHTSSWKDLLHSGILSSKAHLHAAPNPMEPSSTDTHGLHHSPVNIFITCCPKWACTTTSSNTAIASRGKSH